MDQLWNYLNLSGLKSDKKKKLKKVQGLLSFQDRSEFNFLFWAGPNF